jgi:polysaccharide export outer membrane protein
MNKKVLGTRFLGGWLIASIALTGCSGNRTLDSDPGAGTATISEYRLGPGDNLRIFVWRNPEISTTVPVRPDGKISMPLVEDMIAVGKTPTQLAQDIETELGAYIKNPVVNVIVTEFVGAFSEQIRVVGQATNPKAIPYRERMTLLDVIIEVGGLTEFAAGNRAKIIRRASDKEEQIRVRLADLVADGDVSANLPMMPGDILIIPESWF